MPIMNKLLVAASAVATTMILTKPLCLSFPMSHQRRCVMSGRAPPSCSMIHTADGGGGGGVTRPARRRWRRRRKTMDSSKSIARNINDGRVTNDDDVDESRFSLRDDKGQQQSSSQCPIYSMKFPRYRISLTNESSKNLESEQRRIRRLTRGFITKLLAQSSAIRGNVRESVNNTRHGENDHPLGLLKTIFRVWNPSDEILNPSSKNTLRARKIVESFYHEETMQGRFRWITSSFSDSGSSSTTATIGSTKNNSPDEDIYAAASFWRMASDITARLASENDDDDDDYNQRMWYLALPETTSTVAQNLCDTLNWYADYTSQHYKNDAGEALPFLLILHAEMDTRVNNGKIPIVRFTLHCQDPSQQWQKKRQEQLISLHQQKQRKLLLPTSADTERRTKAWVKRVLVELGICPFTKSVVKSGQGLRDLGVPVANIMYRHSSAMGSFGSARSSDGLYLLMADAWEAISDMVAAGPTGVSSILLSAPGFDDDFEFWSGPIFAILETCVGALQAEDMIGVVCFHPNYVTPDGTSWPGFGQMHSVPRLKQWYLADNESSSESKLLSDNEIAAGGAWQRRTPHAVLNVLRADQLEAAEGRRRTGELYGRNIRVLVAEGGIGLEKLTEDLKREQCM